MTYTELYQSVLQKLGQVPADNLAAIDTFLDGLVKKAPKKKQDTREVILNLAGAWKDWDDQQFENFLKQTFEVRRSLFTDRQFDL